MDTFAKIFSVRSVQNTKNRNELLDFVRGCAVLLVLLHHSGMPYGNYILAFHMPLFFILSGYTAALTQEVARQRFGPYIWKKFKRIMIPYFSFELINYMLWVAYCVVFKEPIPTGSAIVSILICVNTEGYTGLCGRLWFLPCIFVCSCVFWILRRLLKKNWMLLVAAACSFGASFALQYFGVPRLPLTLDIMLMALPFLLIGNAAHDSIERLFSARRIWVDIIILLLAVTIFVIACEQGAQMLMYTDTYGDHPMTIIAVLAGSLAFAVIVKCVYRAVKGIACAKDFVMWYSYNSLVIFPVHLQIKCALLFVGTYFACVRAWLVMFVIMLFADIPAVNILNRFFPFVCGDLKRRARKADD